ncbi:MAG: pirin family protein [Chloroflexia bacterium]|nr:pirin family protein [Chloroflexia bacterium]
MNEVRHTNQPASGATLYKSERTRVTVDQGPFVIHINFPGRLVPRSNDHGHGPLAAIAESLLDPGAWIRLHEHSNDEIISWVPEGVMRHNDRTVGELIADPDHLMIMNAGRSFWHEERTEHHDPHLRMLQIFVRPHTLDLEPEIQHGPIDPLVPNEWRHLFGPVSSDAPFTVRNDVHLHDIRLDRDTSVELPAIAGWDTYFYVFTGVVEVDGTPFGEAESGLIVGDGGLTVTAQAPTLLVSFLINPNATTTRMGTVGR